MNNNQTTVCVKTDFGKTLRWLLFLLITAFVGFLVFTSALGTIEVRKMRAEIREKERVEQRKWDEDRKLSNLK